MVRSVADGSIRPRASLPQAACPLEGGRPPSAPVGVSVAFLIGFLARRRPAPEAPPERLATRGVATALKRSRHEAGEVGPCAGELAGETHFITGGVLTGAAAVYVSHAWDASFPDLVACLAADAAGDMDRLYAVDMFATDLQAPEEDPVQSVQRAVTGAKDVLLVLDAEALALGRAWVLFEALLAVAAGKLRVRCSAPAGFGASRQALDQWEARIDAADWMLAQTTRRSDEKRLRSFAEKAWEVGAKSTESRLA